MSNDIWSLLLGLGAGLACGFLNTAASSGSAVSLPILLMIGLDPVSANATNRIPVLIGAVAATASFHKRKALLWGLAVKVSRRSRSVRQPAPAWRKSSPAAILRSL
jgi:uncharacterized protein